MYDDEFDDGYDPHPKAGPTLPKLKPCPDFRFATHPNKWEVDLEIGALVPSLVFLPLRKGAGGVRHDKDETGLRSTYEPQGFTILDPGMLGEISGAPRYYVRRVPLQQGHAHIPAWCTPIPGSERTRLDRALYRSFIAYVATRVPRPNEHQLADMVRRAEEAHARYAERGLTNPLAKRRADEWARRVEVLRAALDEARGVTALEPGLDVEAEPADAAEPDQVVEPDAEPAKRSRRK